MPPSAPVAPRRPTPLPSLHGRSRTDDYAWLRDENWQHVMVDPDVLDADIRAYLEAENAYKEAVLAPAESLRSALFAEFRGRIKEDDSSVPARDGAWEYYDRYRAGGQHPVVCRRAADRVGHEEVLLDGDAEAEGRRYFRVGGCGHTWNHRRFGWTADDNGSEFFTLRVKDLRSGQLLEDVIERCSGKFVWAGDHRTLFYTVLDDNHRPCKVLRHRIGAGAADDVVVYEESDAGFFLNVAATESRRFVVIDAHDHVTSEVRLVEANRPDAAPVLVAARDPGIEYDVSHHGDRLIILTNADGAEDFKIVETPLGSPERDRWRDLVPHRPGVLITSFEVYARWLVRLERENALPRIVVRDLESGDEHAIAFDEEAYSLGLAGGYEFDTDTLRFTYSSMTTPEHVYDYDMRTRKRVVRKVQEVPSGHDPADYATRRILASSHDGEAVPISLLHRRDTPMDGSAPLLLYGYGSYGMSMPASFATTRLSLVDRGYVYAIAHVRGGTECGYAWYTNGKLEKKTNSFHDFISAAETLVEQGFARRGRIAIHGGSAGGLLVGACANMAPDLFHAVIAEVPFVDVLNTICDEALPLTPPEWPEWGNPIESAAAYDRIAAYSPYDNVEARDYPHIIATAGLTDPRVTYWEPAKWVAKLRATKTDDRLLVLHTNMEAGHGGAAGRFDRLKETALVYGFVLQVFGMGSGSEPLEKRVEPAVARVRVARVAFELGFPALGIGVIQPRRSFLRPAPGFDHRARHLGVESGPALPGQ